MSGVQTIAVTDAEDGLRLDRWFRAHFPALTHGRLEKLLRTGQVRVDGGRVKANTRLEPGQMVRVPPLDVAPGGTAAGVLQPRARAVNEADRRFLKDLILHEDEAVLVLNKPYGLAVQGGTGTTRHIDGMLEAMRDDTGERPRLVHRLDRDTSGVLVLARTRIAARALGDAFKARQSEKIYWGLVHGVPPLREGDIKAPLKKDMVPGEDELGERIQVAKVNDKDARHALTRYATVFQAGQKATWLALMPITGRTHQLRVHCAHMDTPLVGDVKYGYGARRPPIGGVGEGLHLHAYSLTIDHPSGGVLSVHAPLSPHMRETWDLLGFSDDHWANPFDTAPALGHSQTKRRKGAPRCG
ncbi:MAG: RluA family pseudouridine synthase [Alphaproteobacteria bacterium]